MSLSKRDDTQRRFPSHEAFSFEPETLALALRSGLPDVEFAYLLGSAAHGEVPRFGDVDVAIYLNPARRPGLKALADTAAVIEGALGNRADADVGVLNRADPIYRFEALKGRLLFARDRELWLRFYSVTCREYEYQMHDYEKQRLYRRQARAAAHAP